MGRASWLARRQLVRERTGNNGSCSYTALEIAFSQKLGVRIENREARDGNFRGKHSGRRNSLPWPQAAIDNSRAIGVIDLPVKSLRGGAIDGDYGENPGSDSLHLPGS